MIVRKLPRTSLGVDSSSQPPPATWYLNPIRALGEMEAWGMNVKPYVGYFGWFNRTTPDGGTGPGAFPHEIAKKHFPADGNVAGYPA